MPISLVAKSHEAGLAASLRLGRDLVQAQIARRTAPGGRAFVFLSPMMNHTGAPQVLMEVVEDFAATYDPSTVRLVSPLIVPELGARARAAGVRVERAAAILNRGLVRTQLALRKGDFVLMNTIAVMENYRTFVLDALESARLDHAHWYIHEDIAQLPLAAPALLEPSLQRRIAEAVERDHLTLLVPSRGVKAQYDRLFSTDKTRVLPFKVSFDARYTGERSVDDYASVAFLLSGKPTDGRKAHFIALAAFHEFMKEHHAASPELYRPFTVTLVGVTDDYIGEQIETIGAAVLGERLTTIRSVTRGEALELTRTCNAVICCSFNEALPLTVIEGMVMGHVVLRNDAGGMAEQLDEGVNGFRVDSRDVRQFARVLEAVLNRSTMTDARLRAMGRASQEMVERLRVASYVDALGLER
jgi:hypothetical protein